MVEWLNCCSQLLLSEKKRETISLMTLNRMFRGDAKMSIREWIWETFKSVFVQLIGVWPFVPVRTELVFALILELKLKACEVLAPGILIFALGVRLVGFCTKLAEDYWEGEKWREGFPHVVWVFFWRWKCFLRLRLVLEGLAIVSAWPLVAFVR